MRAGLSARVLRRGARGFSLVELLVVVGMMALFVGGLGLALRGGGPNTAVQSAQGILASAVAAARSEALASQARTRLVFDADPAHDGYLRTVRIVVENAAGTDVWRYAGSEISLPSGAYVVPAAVVTGMKFQPQSGAAWPAKRISAITAPGTLALSDGTQLANALWTTFDFNLRGLPSASGGKLLVSTATRESADSLVFDSPDLIRGVLVGDYGAPLLLNDGTDIDN